MNPAVVKTISLVVLILLGYSLQSKIKGKEQKAGLKTVILSIALPATIFIALLKIEFSWEMAIVPLLALGFNLTMFWLAGKMYLVQPGIEAGSANHRTMQMLIPSLAPGLSAFPFILEYFGEEPLAMAALADVGNKVFGLILLYLIAMRWYYSRHQMENQPVGAKVKGMLLSLVKEPINMVLLVALGMLAFGFSFSSLPEFFQMSAQRLSLMMTPLVLLFIGISVKLDWHQFRTIFSLLLLRSSIAFLISAILLIVLPVQSIGMALLIVIFPQSACSFWPFAHMSAVGGMEEINDRSDNPTFNLEFAMNILACSLPFSTVLILGICTASDFFATSTNLLVMVGVFGGLALVPTLLHLFRRKPEMVNH
ncbi:MAG: permease [Bacteroidota bacterium]